MSPKNIIAEAVKKGLHIIGICDHNSAENVSAVRKNGEKRGITVIGGIEITTREEVHVLAYFDSLETLLKLQDRVYMDLQNLQDQSMIEEQVVANEDDEVIGFNKKELIGATDINLEQLVDMIHEFDGLAVASHVDRESFSVIGHLGFIPKGISFDALELMDPSRRTMFPLPDGSIFITSSDAHYPWEIGNRWTTMILESPCFEEIKRALRCEESRRVII